MLIAKKIHDEQNIKILNEDRISNSAMPSPFGLYINFYFKIFY